MTDLLTLAVRCEGSEGRERERLRLNGDIALALGIVPIGLKRGGDWGRDRWFSRGKVAMLAFQAPNYCASLDAAMGLVPEGWICLLSVFQDGAEALLHDDRANPVRLPSQEADAATAALALCAASLRARAAQDAA